MCSSVLFQLSACESTIICVIVDSDALNWKKLEACQLEWYGGRNSVPNADFTCSRFRMT